MTDAAETGSAATAAASETPAEATAPKGKTKTKTDDVLLQIVQDISKLSAEQAIAAVPDLLDGADENYFRAGGVLSAISAQKYYQKEGFETFREFVEQKYGMNYRRAMYWIQIYEALIQSGVPWSKVKDVGWTKLKEIAAILTLENVDQWVNTALSSTVLQLQEAVAKAKVGSLATSGITPTDDHSSPITTVTVKVHADQKTIIVEAIEKAKAEIPTEYPGVALEAICMNYMTGGNANKPEALDVTLSKYSPDDILAAMEKAFPDVQIVVKVKKTA